MGERQDVVGVTPPRASGPRAQPVITKYRLWRLRGSRARWVVQPSAWHVLAGVIPGLGHVLTASLIQGACIGTLIIWLVLEGWSRGHNDIGQLILGVAAALHAYSVYDLVPLMYKQELATRLKAMALAGGPLLLLIYLPLTNAMNHRNQNYVMVDSRFVGEYYVAQIVGLVLLAFVAFTVSGAASGALSLIASVLSPRKKP